MRKKWLLPVLALAVLAFALTGCGKQSSGLKKVRLQEVAHSIFYAPMYVALEEGYFEEEGLDVELKNGNGADKVMTAMIAGEADIGFMGPEATIYVYNEGNENYGVNFAQLTQRAGNFLVGRGADPDFKWSDLKGKTVIGGRAGGMPQMVFEYILKMNGLDPKKDVNIIQNIDFGVTAEAFVGGTGDYTVEFEPHATGVEKDGSGAVIASLGVDSGYVPYTCFSALESYMNEHPDVIQSFVKGIQKGLDYVNSHSSEEIAKIIQPQFEETDFDTLKTIVERYHSQDTWKKDTVFTEEAFELLQNILEEAGVLEKRVDYDDLVTTKFSK
ncbi:ABC transporter substrate-binding protein [Frisingicoccus sp.]|jgi:NitT/TauT family transport system substrate-binding protein|uniref:ABC transporter substrate-binding protein n=1 Tax=Frisingicoccus sp. TaxID=1918627 RepID=UPI0015B93B80|nr:ABC transporter substrate-binding protein [Frisingicoccus sp.]MEE0752126.1 ABC transporter substrate-binding protein [Frisingicoccus sp.]